MKIESVSVNNMWSFGSEGMSLANVSRHNVVIGKNNSGKSKVLAALAWIKSNVDSVSQGQPFQLEPHVYHEDGQSPGDAAPVSFTIRITAEAEDVRSIVSGAQDEIGNHDPRLAPLIADFVRPVFSIRVRSDGGNPRQVIGSIEFTDPASIDFGKIDRSAAGLHVLQNNWERIFVRAIYKHVIAALGRHIKYVSGWRTLREPDEQQANIIKRLHMWKSPPQKDKHLRHTFDRVQQLFRKLTLCPDFDLTPEYSGENLSVASGGRYLPIESLGDGVQHLLMIAFHLATAPKSVLLIEEPETHLHPGLQRNLVSVLKGELQGQSFITTHSPVLLDSSLASTVYRIEHDNRTSRVATCQTSADLYRVLDQLDVRASDILQANFVIWVEGPTDRMFLNRCFDLLATGLTEGVHYQIAYYGGRLRSHHTFDGSLPDLVNLLKLCRNVAMVCDSDRSSASDRIDDSKRRLQEECEKAGGFYLVTEGREIENYIPDATLSLAFASLLERSEVTVALGHFEKLDDVLRRTFPNPERGDGWKVKYEDNKARVMPEILKHLSAGDLGRLGLAGRLSALVARIQAANGEHCHVSGHR